MDKQIKTFADIGNNQTFQMVVKGEAQPVVYCKISPLYALPVCGGERKQFSRKSKVFA